MNKIKTLWNYFSGLERTLWCLSVLLILSATTSFLSVVVCFVAFFVNDVYGFLSWKRMERRQAESMDGGK